MKKQTKQLIACASALVAVAAVYGGMRLWNHQKSRQSDQGAVSVINAREITSISFEKTGQAPLSFVKTGNAWSYESDPAFPLDGSYLTKLEETLSPLGAVRAFEQPDSLSDYGLDQPAYRLTVETKTGDTTLLIGSQAASNYYSMVEGKRAVYTIASTLISQIGYNLNQMARLEEIPVISEEALTSVSMQKGESTVLLTQMIGAEPSQWTVGNQSVPEGNSTLEATLSALGNLRFSTLYDYKGGAQALEAAGLDNPDRLNVAGTGESYALLLGEKDSATGEYYAQLEGSSPIYRMSGESVETLLALSESDLLQAK